MTSIRTRLLWANLLLILLAANYIIYKEEKTLREGTTIYLELVPVDPRSLIQGDYIDLRYDLANRVSQAYHPDQGRVVLWRNRDHVAYFSRVYDGFSPLENDELLLRYWSDASGIRFGVEEYLFQEGSAHYYEDAAYAELVVDADGNAVLVGLRDEYLNRLGPLD